MVFRRSFPNRRFQPGASNFPKPKNRQTRIPRIIQEPRFLSNVPTGEGDPPGLFNWAIVVDVNRDERGLFDFLTIPIDDYWDIENGNYFDDSRHEYATALQNEYFWVPPSDPNFDLKETLTFPFYSWTGDFLEDTASFLMDGDIWEGGDCIYHILNTSSDMPEITLAAGTIQPEILFTIYSRGVRTTVIRHKAGGTKQQPEPLISSQLNVSFQNAQKYIEWNVETSEWGLIYGPNDWVEAKRTHKRSRSKYIRIGNIGFKSFRTIPQISNQTRFTRYAHWQMGALRLNGTQPPWFTQAWDFVQLGLPSQGFPINPATTAPYNQGGFQGIQVVMVIVASRAWTEELDLGSPCFAAPGSLDNSRRGDISIVPLKDLVQIGETKSASCEFTPTYGKVHATCSIPPYAMGIDIVMAAFVETGGEATFTTAVDPATVNGTPATLPSTQGARFIAENPIEGGANNIEVNLDMALSCYVHWIGGSTSLGPHIITHELETDVEFDISTRLDAIWGRQSEGGTDGAGGQQIKFGVNAERFGNPDGFVGWNNGAYNPFVIVGNPTSERYKDGRSYQIRTVSYPGGGGIGFFPFESLDTYTSFTASARILPPSPEPKPDSPGPI
jgi:hypothetical protein